MDKFTLSGIVIVCIWLLAIIKLSYDQLNLFKAYKAKIDPSFPALQNEINLKNLITVTKLRLKVIFRKYPDNQEVNKLARKTQRSVVATALVFVLLFILNLFI